MGHITHHCIVRRDLLNDFHIIYGIIQRHYMEKVSLWAAARQELHAYRSMMVVERSSW